MCVCVLRKEAEIETEIGGVLRVAGLLTTRGCEGCVHGDGRWVSEAGARLKRQTERGREKRERSREVHKEENRLKYHLKKEGSEDIAKRKRKRKAGEEEKGG